ncbi:MAG: glycine cleavage system protein GcvH [Romboutsia sp.]
MKVVPNLKYSSKHTWVKLEGEYAYVGITDYAQDQLGEILFVEMPEVEDTITKDEDFGVVESSKVASDLIAPISGEVVEINEKLEDEPECINDEPYESWIIKIKISHEDELSSLLSSQGYESGLE